MNIHNQNIAVTSNTHFYNAAVRKTCYILFCFAFLLLGNSCKTHKSGTSSKDIKSSPEDNLSSKQRIEFERLFFDANREKILGNYPEAENLLIQALHINPTSGAANYELATIYAYRNNRKQSLAFSKKAAAIDPKNIWYQLLYIDCLKENKQINEAINTYQKLLKDFPEHIDLYYELANLYIYEGKGNEAIKVYDRIERLEGVTEESSLSKFKIYKAMNNTEKALSEIQKLIGLFPKESKYYGILGQLYLEKGESDKALAAYNDLLKVDPTNAYVHLSLADYYRKQKQNGKAYQEIKIGFASKDIDIDTKVKILLSFYSVSESFTDLRDDADTLCKLLVIAHPDEAKAFSIYGDFLYRDRKLTEAREQYRKAIALDKSKYALWNQLLIIESELNDYTSMEKESKETMELFPTQPLPYFFNGVSNIQLKRFEPAVAALNDGLEFVYDNEPILAQFYANLGDAQNQLKNYAASDSAYNKALEIEPDNSYVLNNYAYYLSLRNTNLEKAEAMSKKSNELDPKNNSFEDTYGWILFQMKKYDDAKTWIGKAIDDGGKKSGVLLEHYGDVLYKLGETEEALQYWMDAKKAGGTTELIDKKIADKKLYE